MSDTPAARRWSLFPRKLGQSIEGIVKPVYQQHGFSEHRVLTEWVSVVGRELAAGSAPRKLAFPRGKREQGVLHVAVSSGARALELQHMQPVILERIATYFGYRAIEKIVFHQETSLPSATRRRRSVPTAKVALDEATAALIAPCADDALRAALTALATTRAHAIAHPAASVAESKKRG